MSATFNRTRVLGSAALVAMLAFSSPALAADQEKYDLFKEVQSQVLRYSFFTVFDDVNIEIADGGIVVLSGRVTGDHKKADLEKRVATVDGVTMVTNEISVLPASQRDTRLRYLVARAIYGNPNFWSYGVGAQPSIHIIVERGHVTLTGVVHNEVDRTLARALAGQFDAFSVTNELRLPAEVTAELEQLG